MNHRSGATARGRPRGVAARVAATLGALALVAACGGGGGEGGGVPASPLPLPSDSLSRSTAPYKAVDRAHHAASRFLEQASFGPEPASVAALRDGRFEAWIDAQRGLPPTLLDASAVRNRSFDDPEQTQLAVRAAYRAMLAAPDQLRLRTSWALSQLLVVSTARVSGWAAVQHFNLLQQRAFGSYRDLLRAVTVHASMGFYQDNVLNRRAGAWPGATPNENYARELMQLFTIGLVELNPDGTPRRDARGAPIQTYSQREVEELARALTGWEFDTAPNRPSDTDFGNFAVPLRTNAVSHDFGAKRIVGGATIPAGGDASADLDAVLDVLMRHPNTAPFVSTRLIQHLTTGDPSPAYVSRVAGVFRATEGDLGRVVKAILLDPEARAGDDPLVRGATKGKVKEPVLARIQLLRAFGCTDVTRSRSDSGTWLPGQVPFAAPTVFNFYPPTYRIPGTPDVAPEFKLLNAQLLQQRANDPSALVHWRDDGEGFRNGGCSRAAWDAAMAEGNDAAIELISNRLFRGAMPAYVRDVLVSGVLAVQPGSPDLRIYDAVGIAALSPAWGVMR